MPIPSFSDTLDKTLGPGITIISGGSFFTSDENNDASGLDIKKMNAELAATTREDDIVFMLPEPPKEDISLKQFLESQKK